VRRPAARAPRSVPSLLGGRAWPLFVVALAVLLGVGAIELTSAGGTPGTTLPSASFPMSAAGTIEASPEPTATELPSPSPSDLPTETPPTSPPTIPPTSPPTPAPTLKPGFSLHVPILTYHVIAPWSVASAYSQPALDIDPSVFDAQLALLKSKGWQTITVDRLYGYLAAKQRPPRKTFVITIDDGHDDGYTYALPILQKYGFVATYYVVAGRVGRLDNLTWDEIATLQADGMEIGNHTLNHLKLTTLSATQVAAQITSAQQLLTEHLGSAPTTFAYPFGAYDLTAIQAVRAAGLKMAVTTRRGAYEAWSVRDTIDRIGVDAGVTPAQVLAYVSPYA